MPEVILKHKVNLLHDIFMRSRKIYYIGIEFTKIKNPADGQPGFIKKM